MELNKAKAAAAGSVTAIFSGGRLEHCPTGVCVPIAITIPITEVGWKPENCEELINQCSIVFAFVHAGVMDFDVCQEYLSHCFGLSDTHVEAIGWDTFYALRLAFKYYPPLIAVPPGPVDSACCNTDAVDAAHEWAAERLSSASDEVMRLFDGSST